MLLAYSVNDSRETLFPLTDESFDSSGCPSHPTPRPVNQVAADLLEPPILACACQSKDFWKLVPHRTHGHCAAASQDYA